MIKKKVCCILEVAFQLAPVIRYYDTLIYALKARKCEKVGDRNGQRLYYFKMLKEDQDVALLRIFECFLEAAPQQILQLTILLKHNNRDINFECTCSIRLFLIEFNCIKVPCIITRGALFLF